MGDFPLSSPLLMKNDIPILSRVFLRCPHPIKDISDTSSTGDAWSTTQPSTNSRYEIYVPLMTWEHLSIPDMPLHQKTWGTAGCPSNILGTFCHSHILRARILTLIKEPIKGAPLDFRYIDQDNELIVVPHPDPMEEFDGDILIIILNVIILFYSLHFLLDVVKLVLHHNSLTMTVLLLFTILKFSWHRGINMDVCLFYN